MARNSKAGVQVKSSPRRGFLKSATAGALLAGGAQAAEGAERVFKVLDQTSRLDVRGEGTRMIETAYRLGREYEKTHKGCARCTVAALQQALDFLPEDESLFRAASCLDGGSTPAGVQNCGAFTGAGMVIGYVCGTGSFEAGRAELAHKLIRQVYAEFEKAYGTVLCKDVKAKANSDCVEVVGRASRWTAEVLLRQFTNHT